MSKKEINTARLNREVEAGRINRDTNGNYRAWCGCPISVATLRTHKGCDH